MRRIYGYLIKVRGIDKSVIDVFADKRMIYESEEYHNVVFVDTIRTAFTVMPTKRLHAGKHLSWEHRQLSAGVQLSLARRQP
ncbi:MAG: DUF3991 domain-containing protein [Hydrogeniiclostridium mannosilyticum]